VPFLRRFMNIKMRSTNAAAASTTIAIVFFGLVCIPARYEGRAR